MFTSDWNRTNCYKDLKRQPINWLICKLKILENNFKWLKIMLPIETNNMP